METTDSPLVDSVRRGILGTAAVIAAAASSGVLTLREARAASTGSKRATHFLSADYKHVHAGLLDVAYVDAGPPDGPVVLLLHGWPYDVQSFAEVVPLLVAARFRVIVPFVRGYGPTRFLSETTMRNGQPAALASDVIALMDALRIDKAVVAGFDWGARTANVVSALWPERVIAMVSVSGYLVGSQETGRKPLAPKAELSWWYQFYMATERGRIGYEQYRREFAKLIWQIASPQWSFPDDVFERTAVSFENPDHVAVVVHNYRWRLGVVDGEEQYALLEAKLANFPAIDVPTITMEGDANGAPHPDPAAYAKKFTGRYQHRTVTAGVGHNLPQEAPVEFAKAVIDVASA